MAVAYTQMPDFKIGQEEKLNEAQKLGKKEKGQVFGAKRLFQKRMPGAPGKLGKSSTKAESLSKLRGKGAIS